ncbi:lipocalin-like domain-containing protein [Streptomyces sp. DSM 44917]|uniref:Lipocalin-like domain-containing protein n=1 Tax=Streptomyces boetiae TaxID=3075541 RepID=A0ABU2L4J9_9ACTN|nr:lipocalin-like domain-containing protein [Streptomyces sp. DSM 44917]MDT0306486.1 lipocalin-like domain-containing protein [Streptomyces sp. DSM 44917]
MTLRPEALIGAWELRSLHDLDDGGRPVEGPLGRSPRGQLLYTADGRVSVHMMRAPEERDGSADQARYMGYGGTWSLTDGQLVHRTTVTPVDHWIDRDHPREAELEGDRLTLRGDAVVDGRLRHRVLVWQRAQPGAGAATRQDAR